MKQKKLKSLKSLDKLAWKYFSVYIRSKDADFDGSVPCFTCGRSDHWRNMDAGHFIKRTYLAVKFDERNVFPQCSRCNRYLHGNQDEFALRLLNLIGKEQFNELFRLKYEAFKPTRQYYEDLITRYRGLHPV